MNAYFSSRWCRPETVSFRGEAFTAVYVSQEKPDIGSAHLVAEEVVKANGNLSMIINNASLSRI